MNGHDLLDKLELVNPTFIEAAKTEFTQKRSPHISWIAIAACFCLIVTVIITQLPLHPFRPTNPNPLPQIENTSDTYQTLPELLAYLSKHETHTSTEGQPIKGNSTNTAVSTVVENNGVVLDSTKRYSYHIGTDAVFISHLNETTPVKAGQINIRAKALFVCDNRLIIVAEYQEEKWDGEYSARVTIYDISNPETPSLQDEYCQQGSLTACWMVDEKLYLATSDGECACGWSRLEDTMGYYPSLTCNGEILPWENTSITILGEPTKIQYTAVTMFDGKTGKVAKQKAIYGDIKSLSYGVDWLAAVVTATHKSPDIYTFDGSLDFSGKISTAKIFSPTNPPSATGNLTVASLTKADNIYRLLGTYTDKNDPDADAFVAITASPKSGKTTAVSLSREKYPYSAYTEILWEENRAVICVKIEEKGNTASIRQKTKFLFCEFDGMNSTFFENELIADYLSDRIGISYGDPLGEIKTLIPLGGGQYVRYTASPKGPGGFDVYDFTESTLPKLLYHADKSLGGENAFDYTWQVYNPTTFGTLKVVLGEKQNIQNVNLVWCVYETDLLSGNLTLLHETALNTSVDFFLGADNLGLTLFSDGSVIYFVTRTETVAKILQ